MPHVYMCVGTCGGIKALKTGVIVSHLPWVMGMNLQNSVRAASILNHWAISPAQSVLCNKDSKNIAQRVLICKMALDQPPKAQELKDK